MKRLGRIILQNAVRLSFFLVVLFAVGIVVLTGRFVLMEDTSLNNDTAGKAMKGIDRGLFDQVTQHLQEKTSTSVTVAPGIRDPFSLPFAPLPPPAPSPEDTVASDDGATPPADTPADTAQ